MKSLLFYTTLSSPDQDSVILKLLILLSIHTELITKVVLQSGSPPILLSRHSHKTGSVYNLGVHWDRLTFEACLRQGFFLVYCGHFCICLIFIVLEVAACI